MMSIIFFVGGIICILFKNDQYEILEGGGCHNPLTPLCQFRQPLIVKIVNTCIIFCLCKLCYILSNMARKKNVCSFFSSLE